MHLYIEQNTGLTEPVSSGVIKKLYDLAIGGLDDTSNLIGSVSTTVTSAQYKTYLEGLFPNFHITADQYTLTFEDAEVERLCVANWGSNGGVTLNQLQAVTSVGTVFRGNTNIVKFNEYQNFTGLTVQYSNYNQQTFSGCTNLKEIVLPSNTSYIGNQMFQNCSSLESLTIPNSVKEVLSSAFSGCSSIQSLVFTGLTGACLLGNGLTSLTTWQVNSGCTSMTAENCNALTSITIPGTVTMVSLTNCLDYNTEVTIPASVTSLRMVRCRMKKVIFEQRDPNVTFVTTKDQFAGCSSLQTIENFPSNYSYENPTYIYGSLFQGCSSLTTLIQPPSNCTSIPINLYRECSSLQGTIEVPATCTSIGNGAFYRCPSLTAVKIYATTPPSLNSATDTFQMGYGQALTNGFDILVPNSALATYQADSEWSVFGSRLKGFS